jgi:hypothetical protein
MPINRRTIIALGLAFALLATPAAAQPYQDLRNPDNRPTATVVQDFGSPDARDLANHYNPQPDGPVTPAPEPASVEAVGTSTAWTTTLLAAGGYLLAIVAGGFALAVRSRSRGRVAA